MLALLLATTLLFGWRFVDFSLPPVEDAAILMRYARNFAAGHGIVWNVGEAPVDGATDFLLVIVVGLIHRAGVSLESSVLGLCVAAHLATVALVYLGMRRVQSAGTFAAASTALYVAVGPGLAITAAYFGTTFFSFAAALAWLFGQRLVLGERRAAADGAAFAGAAVLASLIRPEGALLAFFMTLGIALTLPRADARRLVAIVMAVFLTLGGAYFLWRWQYFGHPLPNPFYKKGGWKLHGDGLRAAAANVARLCFPFWLAYAVPLTIGARERIRLAVGFMIPFVGFTAIWLLLGPEMNFAGRFQYPLLPVTALSWFPLARISSADARLVRAHRLLGSTAARLAIVAMVVALLAWRVDASARIVRGREGNYDVALLLRPYADRGYTIATSEAGLLPLYSEWRAVDTWGLNDPWVAQRGGITEEYLMDHNPAVIMWHEYFSPLAPLSPSRTGPWVEMVRTLDHFATERGFVLAAVFGISPQDTHDYWVAPDLPECAEIVERIRSVPYPWPMGGGRARNYAEATAQSATCRMERSSSRPER